MTTTLAARTNDGDIELIIHSDLSEATDRLRVMRDQEENTYKKNYGSGDDRNLDQKSRLMMCQWCYQVVDLCEFQRETVSIALSILDRFLSTTQGREALSDCWYYHLAAMTALYISIKLNETVSLDIQLLERLSLNTYNRREFEKMEIRMISALGWRLNRPTPLAFLRCFMALMPPSVDPAVTLSIMEYARYEVELAVFKSCFVHCFPSEIAIAAIIKAISEIDNRSFPEEMKADFVFAVKRYSGLNMNSAVDTKSDPLRIGRETTFKKKEASNSDQLSAKLVTHPNSPVAVTEKLLL